MHRGVYTCADTCMCYRQASYKRGYVLASVYPQRACGCVFRQTHSFGDEVWICTQAWWRYLKALEAL